MACRLTELRETPAVSAIRGSTSSYSRVETPRNNVPSIWLLQATILAQVFVRRNLHRPNIRGSATFWR